MVDCGNSKAHMDLFLKVLEENKLPLPNYAVVSHWHWDHSFGMHAFPGQLILSRETNDKLKYLSSLRWDKASILKRLETGEEIPFAYESMRNEYENFEDILVSCGHIIFEKRLTLDLGNKTCEIMKVGGPHESDSSLVLLSEDKILFAADAHSGDYYNNQGKFDPKKLDAYINLLKSLDFETYIPGHDEAISKSGIIDVLEKILASL